MSHLLEFSSASPLPHDVSAPPYAVFGVYGSDITSSLPPRIPLQLVLHFAPALRRWILPTPDPTCLPRIAARHSLNIPCVGIDIQALIDAVGLSWVIVRMFHLSGCRVTKETFGVHPDLVTSIAIHNAWLALELPIEGIRGLHTHIYSQLIYTEPPVSIWAMTLLWDAFPAGSEIIKAMGLNFIRGHMNMEYSASQSLEIIAWFQSTPERYALFNSLRYAMPEVPEPEIETVTIAAEEAKKISGYKTIGKKIGKAIKKMVLGESTTEVRDVGIMERGGTRKVSPQEKQEREAGDFEALKTRLRRTRSDDSLRSVETAIWNPQTTEDKEEEVTVNDDMDDRSNYPGGNISTDLARTLETIRLRREARNAKHKRAPSLTAVLTTENLKRSEDADKPISRRGVPVLRHCRSSSTSTTGKEHGLSIANLQRRIEVLKEKRNFLM
ncbi:hypothetical protein E8E12_003306 [Didymella heteroderae]|uniref:Uncharacterized protein n=1 Tax=Didymella heteroderae TaxID=1769908 RepID=A0A9P4WKG0_9PLEO|nr:hypothetical protein E8E12_003306 [Didymella heteroderae]